MIKKKLLFLLILTIPLFLRGQVISYNEIDSFSFDLFKMPQSELPLSYYAAKIASRFVLSMNNIRNDTLIIQVETYLYSSKSWVKEEFINDTSLLQHEKLHLEISELFARKLRKEIFQLDSLNYKDYERVVKSIYGRFFTKALEEQARYDSETNHGLNVQKQKEWKERIEEELEKTSMFSDTLIYVQLTRT